jgi:serine protease
MKSVIAAAILMVSSPLVSQFGNAESTPQPANFIEAVSALRGLQAESIQSPIVIAIVDDGVRLTHHSLQQFIWTNPNEIPDNQLDDDGNGYTDDIHGWDVADDNNTVQPPSGRLEFYHGTHLAGIVAQVASYTYGETASDYIRIMPVKALADSAETTYLKRAYKGIEYAIDAGVDIILCSWSLATLSDQEARIMQRAADAGILIVASAGNVPDQREQFPAATKETLAVTSLDHRGQKSARANFGPFVDLAAPGEAIEAAGVTADDTYQIQGGTSSAAAIVAAAAAVVKVQHPDFSAQEIKACLISSAQPITPDNEVEQGQLGAGALNLAAAVDCALLTTGAEGLSHFEQPKAYLRAAPHVLSPVEWVIEPQGDIKGIRFTTVLNQHSAADGTLEFSNGNAPDARLIGRYSLQDLPDSVYVAGTTAQVRYLPKEGGSAHDWLLRYGVDVIDSRTRYCKGTQRLTTEGVLTDGSGEHDYSGDSDCKWLITAPPGKLIQFNFSHLDTETQVDKLYFFNGAGTHETVMAISSGRVLPPILTTWSNQVLVWFVTDGENQGQGWRTEFHFVDPPKHTP